MGATTNRSQQVHLNNYKTLSLSQRIYHKRAGTTREKKSLNYNQPPLILMIQEAMSNVCTRIADNYACIALALPCNLPGFLCKIVVLLI